jgi:hypothetical protein
MRAFSMQQQKDDELELIPPVQDEEAEAEEGEEEEEKEGTAGFQGHPVNKSKTFANMVRRYGKIQKTQFPIKLIDMAWEDVLAMEGKIAEEFGLSKKQVRYLIKNRPSILLMDTEEAKE